MMLWFKNKYKTVSDELLKSVENEEGYVSKAYIDTLVKRNPEQHGIPLDEFAIIEKHLDKLKLTFGMGLTHITKEEALKVTEMRLEATKKQVMIDYPHIKNNSVLEVLTQMSYQLGRTGLAGFKKMLNAIKYKDYKEASLQGLQSKWHKQTPQRAERLMKKLLNS